MNARTVFSVLAAAALLSACGNKGPLVMPQQPVPVEQQQLPTPAEPAPADEPAADDADAADTSVDDEADDSGTDADDTDTDDAADPPGAGRG
ncbi:LPS translocon maturation chaperone LptM [Pseudoxanthomonas suwonensis]|uniref:LPS translocon maturation chaperone LptM n=1 Tax=Pseudoxanthomonas suwonensis TaxID=314722 RepID=UPI000465F3B3